MKTADEYAGSAGRVPSSAGDGSSDQSRPAPHFRHLDPKIAMGVRELHELAQYHGVPVDDVADHVSSYAVRAEQLVLGLATCTPSRAAALAVAARPRSVDWARVTGVGVMAASALFSGIGIVFTLNFLGRLVGWW